MINKSGNRAKIQKGSEMSLGQTSFKKLKFIFQVETMSLQDSIKIPVAVLKAGETRHARLDIEFPDAPVTFTLIQVFYY